MHVIAEIVLYCEKYIFYIQYKKKLEEKDKYFENRWGGGKILTNFRNFNWAGYIESNLDIDKSCDLLSVCPLIQSMLLTDLLSSPTHPAIFI